MITNGIVMMLFKIVQYFLLIAFDKKEQVQGRKWLNDTHFSHCVSSLKNFVFQRFCAPAIFKHSRVALSFVLFDFLEKKIIPIFQQVVNLSEYSPAYFFLSHSTPLTFSSIFFIIREQTSCLQCRNAHTSSAQCWNQPCWGRTLCLEHSCGKCSGTVRETLPFRHLVPDSNFN